jgi:hypothetical protein
MRSPDPGAALFVNAFETEPLPIRISGFCRAIQHQDQFVAWLQLEMQAGSVVKSGWAKDGAACIRPAQRLRVLRACFQNIGVTSIDLKFRHALTWPPLTYL